MSGVKRLYVNGSLGIDANESSSRFTCEFNQTLQNVKNINIGNLLINFLPTNPSIPDTENTLIMNIGGTGMALRMFRYFHGICQLNNNLEEKVTIFDEPLCLTEIPQMLHKYYETTQYPTKAKCLIKIDKINRNFNNTEKAEAEKFDEVFIDDVVQIPTTYPLAAYGKIYINRWIWNSKRDSYNR